MNDDKLNDEESNKETDADIKDDADTADEVLEHKPEVFLDGSNPGENPSEVGLDELATSERMEEDEQTERDRRRLPSDLQSPGDPNAGDVGISGGIASGESDISDIEGEDVESDIEGEL